MSDGNTRVTVYENSIKKQLAVTDVKDDKVTLQLYNDGHPELNNGVVQEYSLSDFVTENKTLTTFEATQQILCK